MKYRTIMADPPWPETSKGPRGSAALSMDLLSLVDIITLPVTRVAHDEAHLYLWATQRSLQSAFVVMGQWGFIFKSLLVWAKLGLGSGFYYFRPNTEFLLFGTRGGACLPIRTRSEGTHHLVRKEMPQQKPDYFRMLAEDCSYPPRLELFARAEREGWTCWGNEVGDPLGWGFEPGKWVLSK